MEMFEQLEENGTIDFDEYLYHKEAVFANLNMAEVEKLGANIRDFIIVCRFDGVPCDLENDFAIFHDAQYSACFTYTGNKNANKYTGIGELHGTMNIQLARRICFSIK